jgi:hypothetical protein
MFSVLRCAASSMNFVLLNFVRRLASIEYGEPCHAPINKNVSYTQRTKPKED